MFQSDPQRHFGICHFGGAFTFKHSRKKITKKEGKKFLFKKYFLTSTFKTIPCHQKILSIYEEEEEEEEEGGGGAFRQLIAASGLPNPTRFQFSRQSASNR